MAEPCADLPHRLPDEQFVVDETLCRGGTPGKPCALDPDGNPPEFRLLHVIEFADNGDVRRANVWVDFAGPRSREPEASGP